MYVYVKPYGRFFPLPPALYSIFFSLTCTPEIIDINYCVCFARNLLRGKKRIQRISIHEQQRGRRPRTTLLRRTRGRGTGARAEDLIIFMRSYLVCTTRSVRVICGKRDFFFPFFLRTR